MAIDPAAAEHRLRLRAEEVVALAAFGPPVEVMAELATFEAAAFALCGAGVLPPGRSTDLVSDVVDALVVRGASWLAPAVPALDPTRLYDASAGGQGPQLRRVVAVGARLDHGTLTSVELWSDRAVARLVGPDGEILPSHVVGAAGVDDRRLELRDAAGGSVGVDLTEGRPVRESPGRVEPSSVDRHLAAVEALAVATIHRQGSVDGLNVARGRLETAAGTLAPERAAELLARFDDAVAAVAVAAETAGSGAGGIVLAEVIPIAARFFGGWLLSVECWSDHWRAVVVPEDPADRAEWTAIDDRGRAYGSTPLDREVLRFDPPLPASWSEVRLERHARGEVLAVEVRR
jgi:hypothetical protein